MRGVGHGVTGRTGIPFFVMLKVAKAKAGGMGKQKKAESHFAAAGRIGGIVSAVIYFILGIVGCILEPWVGIYMLLVSLPLAMQEVPLAPFARWTGPVMDKMHFRAIIYVIISIPTFFNIPAFFAGICTFVVAGLYLVAHFKGELPPMEAINEDNARQREMTAKAAKAQNAGEQQKQQYASAMGVGAQGGAAHGGAAHGGHAGTSKPPTLAHAQV